MTEHQIKQLIIRYQIETLQEIRSIIWIANDGQEYYYKM
jgi:hypothetical protein